MLTFPGTASQANWFTTVASFLLCYPFRGTSCGAPPPAAEEQLGSHLRAPTLPAAPLLHCLCLLTFRLMTSQLRDRRQGGEDVGWPSIWWNGFGVESSTREPLSKHKNARDNLEQVEQQWAAARVDKRVVKPPRRPSRWRKTLKTLPNICMFSGV